jgi:hypothetical protein
MSEGLPLPQRWLALERGLQGYCKACFRPLPGCGAAPALADPGAAALGREEHGVAFPCQIEWLYVGLCELDAPWCEVVVMAGVLWPSSLMLVEHGLPHLKHSGDPPHRGVRAYPGT